MRRALPLAVVLALVFSASASASVGDTLECPAYRVGGTSYRVQSTSLSTHHRVMSCAKARRVVRQAVRTNPNDTTRITVDGRRWKLDSEYLEGCFENWYAGRDLVYLEVEGSYSCDD
jgi:hypothetical protein